MSIESSLQDPRKFDGFWWGYGYGYGWQNNYKTQCQLQLLAISPVLARKDDIVHEYHKYIDAGSTVRNKQTT